MWDASARSRLSVAFPPLEQRVFRLRYELGLTFDQTLSSLTHEFTGLTEGRGWPRQTHKWRDACRPSSAGPCSRADRK